MRILEREGYDNDYIWIIAINSSFVFYVELIAMIFISVFFPDYRNFKRIVDACGIP